MAVDHEAYKGDQAYQMYQELLEIVAENEEDDSTTDVTQVSDSRGYAPNMPVVAEESETEYPSFKQQKSGKSGGALQRGDSEFDEVINNVLGENRRDDLSDDDDDY